MTSEGPGMGAGKIRIKSLAISLAVVMAVEAVTRLGVGAGIYNPIIFLGTVRLLEAGLLVMIVLMGERGLSAIGLSLKGVLPGLRKGLIWSTGFGAVALLSFFLLYAIGQNPLTFIHIDLPAKPSDILFFFLVGGLIGPVTEEIFFRGLLYGFLRRWGALTAILVSTLAFVSAHPVFPGVPTTQAVGGLLFAVAYEIEKNLMVPIVIHVSGNTAILTLSLI